MPELVYIYLFDTMADWEIGYITTGISNPMMQIEPGKYAVKTASIDGEPVRTMGGLQVIPDMSLAEVTPAKAAMLILPGGTSWNEGKNREVLSLAQEFHNANIPVAAICGATLGLAQAGILDKVSHTSNAEAYLEPSGYKGSGLYTQALSIRDQGVITAPGTAALEFSRDVFEELGLYTDKVLGAWYHLFKTSEPHAFEELMEASTIDA